MYHFSWLSNQQNNTHTFLSELYAQTELKIYFDNLKSLKKKFICNFDVLRDKLQYRLEKKPVSKR